MDATSPPLCVAETVTGKPGIVDLWYYFYETTSDPDLHRAQAALMTVEESERHQRLRFERDRRQFVATRALVRTVLSNYTSVAPGAWRFAASPHGKPHIDQPRVKPPIYFNLANTSGLVVCAVSVAHEAIGVDVERIDREIEIELLAEKNFSEREFRTLRALPASEQQRQFFAYWTLKESYIKALGVGLALPLDQFSFLLDGQGISAAWERAQADKATDWKFTLLGAPQHLLGVAARTDGAPFSLRAAHVVPLGESEPRLA
ncbi:MAG TPA: 4'-phosphopantetheinyl transferase superfamily protein [Candidatus Baltobacteraceae bacterium]|jgi:4'-phosphopantetheinyl transferase|nr:4'-phosphopantetheinyl transferase superfamily protein [Candidatus Baltobacteraceae bacterium]